MDTWRLVDLGVFLTFFSTPSCLASFSFLGHTFAKKFADCVQTCFAFLDLVPVFLFCGGFVSPPPPPHNAPLLALYKYRGVGVGDIR